MIPRTSTGLPRPALLTLSDLQRRRAELLAIPLDHQPDHQQEAEPGHLPQEEEHQETDEWLADDEAPRGA